MKIEELRNLVDRENVVASGAVNQDSLKDNVLERLGAIKENLTTPRYVDTTDYTMLPAFNGRDQYVQRLQNENNARIDNLASTLGDHTLSREQFDKYPDFAGRYNSYNDYILNRYRQALEADKERLMAAPVTQNQMVNGYRPTVYRDVTTGRVPQNNGTPLAEALTGAAQQQARNEARNEMDELLRERWMVSSAIYPKNSPQYEYQQTHLKKIDEKLEAIQDKYNIDTTPYSFGKGLKGAVMEGISTSMTGVGNTLAFAEDVVLAPLEWLTGSAPGTLSDNAPFNQLAEQLRLEDEQIRNYYAENVRKGGTAGRAFDAVLSGTVAAAPQAVLALMTGGASTMTTAGLQATSTAALSPSLSGTVMRTIVNTAKDPNFWLAFAQEAGSDYEQALADGASRNAATLYALGAGIMNAYVEVGGGIQTLPQELAGSKAAWRAFVESAIDEGKEEIAQGMIERASQNLFYGKGNKLFSTTDENAVINPVTSAKEGAMGAAIGAILGAGQTGATKIINRVQANAVAKSQAEKNALPNMLGEAFVNAVANNDFSGFNALGVSNNVAQRIVNEYKAKGGITSSIVGALMAEVESKAQADIQNSPYQIATPEYNDATGTTGFEVPYTQQTNAEPVQQLGNEQPDFNAPPAQEDVTPEQRAEIERVMGEVFGNRVDENQATGYTESVNPMNTEEAINGQGTDDQSQLGRSSLRGRPVDEGMGLGERGRAGQLYEQDGPDAQRDRAVRYGSARPDARADGELSDAEVNQYPELKSLRDRYSSDGISVGFVKGYIPGGVRTDSNGNKYEVKSAGRATRKGKILVSVTHQIAPQKIGGHEYNHEMIARHGDLFSMQAKALLSMLTEDERRVLIRAYASLWGNIGRTRLVEEMVCDAYSGIIRRGSPITEDMCNRIGEITDRYLAEQRGGSQMPTDEQLGAQALEMLGESTPEGTRESPWDEDNMLEMALHGAGWNAKNEQEQRAREIFEPFKGEAAYMSSEDRIKLSSGVPVNFNKYAEIEDDAARDLASTEINFRRGDADKIYSELLENGDISNARLMLKAAAIQAGWEPTYLYHGTGSFGFTKFDPAYSDDKRSLFTTNDPYISQSYVSPSSTVRDVSGNNLNIFSYLESPKQAAALVDLSYLAKDAPNIFDSSVDSLDAAFKSKFTPEFRDALEFGRDDDLIEASIYAQDDLAPSKVAEDAVRYFRNVAQKYNMGSLEKLLKAGFSPTATKDEFYSALDDLAFESDQMASNLEMLISATRFLDRKTYKSPELNALRDASDYALKIFEAAQRAIELLYEPDDNISIFPKRRFKNPSEGIYQLFGHASNMMEIDAGGGTWSNILPFDQKDGQDYSALRDALYDLGEATKSKFNTRAVAEVAEKAGYRGVIIRNLYDLGGLTLYRKPGDIYIWFDGHDLKSADLETFYDDGTPIPLSERFSGSDDIRESPWSEGAEQQDINSVLEDMSRNREEQDWMGWANSFENEAPPEANTNAPVSDEEMDEVRREAAAEQRKRNVERKRSKKNDEWADVDNLLDRVRREEADRNQAEQEEFEEKKSKEFFGDIYRNVPDESSLEDLQREQQEVVDALSNPDLADSVKNTLRQRFNDIQRDIAAITRRQNGLPFAGNDVGGMTQTQLQAEKVQLEDELKNAKNATTRAAIQNRLDEVNEQLNANHTADMPGPTPELEAPPPPKRGRDVPSTSAAFGDKTGVTHVSETEQERWKDDDELVTYLDGTFKTAREAFKFLRELNETADANLKSSINRVAAGPLIDRAAAEKDFETVKDLENTYVAGMSEHGTVLSQSMPTTPAARARAIAANMFNRITDQRRLRIDTSGDNKGIHIREMNEQERAEYQKVMEKTKDWTYKAGGIIHAYQAGGNEADAHLEMYHLLKDICKERGYKLSARDGNTLSSLTTNEIYDTCMAAAIGYMFDKAPRTASQYVRDFQLIAQLLNPTTILKNITTNAVVGPLENLTTLPATIADAILSPIAKLQSKSNVDASNMRTIAPTGRLYQLKNIKAGLNEAKVSIARADINAPSGSKGKYDERVYQLENSSRHSTALGNLLGGTQGVMERLLQIALGTTDSIMSTITEQNVEDSLRKFVGNNSNRIDAETSKLLASRAGAKAYFHSTTEIGEALASINAALNYAFGVGSSGTRTGKILGKEVSVHDFGLGDVFANYARTAGNIAQFGLEYTPLGVIKAMHNLFIMSEANRLVAEGKGNQRYFTRRGTERLGFENLTNQQRAIVAQREAAMSIARPIVGTMLVSAFRWLAQMGILMFTDPREENDDKKASDQAKGLGGVQLNLGAIGRVLNGQYDPGQQDDDAVVNLTDFPPFDTLAEVAGVWNELDKENPDAETYLKILSGVSLAASTVLGNQSMMKTYETISNGIEYRDRKDAEGNPLTPAEQKASAALDIATGLAADSITGFVPGWIRRLASATDDYKRDVYTDNAADTIWNKIKNAIPGLRKTLPEKLDSFGNPVENDMSGIVNTLLNPYPIRHLNISNVDEFVDSIGVYPEHKAPSYFTYDADGDGKTERYNMSTDEQRKWHETYTNAYNDVVQQLMDSAHLDELSEDEQKKILSNIKSYSLATAKNEYLDSLGLSYDMTSNTSAQSIAKALGAITQAQEKGSDLDLAQYYIAKREHDRINDAGGDKVKEFDRWLSSQSWIDETERQILRNTQTFTSIRTEGRIAEDGKKSDSTFENLESFGIGRDASYTIDDALAAAKEALPEGEELKDWQKYEAIAGANVSDADKLKAILYYERAERANGPTMRERTQQAYDEGFSIDDIVAYKKLCSDYSKLGDRAMHFDEYGLDNRTYFRLKYIYSQ